MTRDEILNPSLGFSTQETRGYNDQNTAPATTSTKTMLLSQKKEEKLYSLAGKVGTDDLTAKELDVGDNTLYMSNKILNDYSPAELNYFQSKRYDEAGVYPDVGADGQVQGYLEKDAQGNLVPFQGSQDDIRSLYLFGTQGREDVNKLGVSWDPEAYGRYAPKDGNPDVDAYGKTIGPVGVDRDNRKMALAYRGQEADLFEALRHGNESTIPNREYLNKVGGQDDKAYWGGRKEFGTGATEAYKGGLTGTFGSDAEQGLPENIEQRYLDFKAKYGLTDKEQAVSGELGSISGKYEASGDPSAVNADDQGAPSYGKYQLSTAAGTMQDFLSRAEGQKLRNVMGNLNPASEEFQARFKKAMQSSYGKDLLADQQKYIQNTHYEPVAAYAKELGIDTSIPAVQEMLWSQSVQHSGKGNKAILDTAMANLPENASYEDLVKGVYAARNEYARKYVANPTDIAADRYTNEQNDVLAMLSQAPVASTDKSTTGKASLEERIAQIKRDNMSTVDKVIEETQQSVSGALAGLGQGALDLVDAVQEGATYPAQLLYNAVTGENKDIDLFDDDLKKSMVEGLQDIVGYDQLLDADSQAKALDLIEGSGAELLSPSTWHKLLTTEEGRGAIKEYLTNPSMTANSLTQIVGAGGALGAGTKLVGRVGTKIAPKLADKVSKALSTNRQVVTQQLKEARMLPAAERAVAEKVIKDSYTLGKRLPDLLKGSVYTNADMAIRMNNDITEFKTNNDGEEPSPEKLVQMFALNRLASSAEVGSLKLSARIGKETVEGLKAGVKEAVKKIGTHVVKSTGVEAAQETLDGVVQTINQKLGSKEYEGKTLGDVLEDSSSEIIGGMLAGGAMGTHIGGAMLAKESLQGGLLGKAVKSATGAVGSGLEGAKNLVKGTTDTVSSIRDDVKQALGGDEEVKQNLQSTGATPEERKANLESYETASSEAIAAEVSDMVSAITGQENGKVTAENAQQAADKVVQSTLNNIQAFNEDISSKADLSDAEKEKLAGSNTHEHLSNVANLLAAMRVSGRNEEAAHLSKSLLNRMPNMVKYFGTNPEALESFTSAVVKEAVSLNSTITKDDIAKVMSSVKALADAGEINSTNLADMQKAITTAVKVGNAYKTVKKVENSTSEVALDAATGERGFLTYYDGYSTAISKGDVKAATAYAEQISNFMSIMDNKSEALGSAVTKAEAVVSRLITEAKARKAKDPKINLRAEVFSNLPKEGIKVDYNTGSRQSFEINYKDVASHILDDNKDLKGVYKVLDNLTSEILAMNTLYDYASRNLTGVKSKEEVKKTEPKPNTKEPKKPESPRKSSKPEKDYSGTYTEGGSDYTVVKGEDGSYTLDGHPTAESVVRGLSKTAKKKSKVEPKAEEPQQSKPKAEKVAKDYLGTYRTDNDPSNDVVLKQSGDGNYTMQYRGDTYTRSEEQVETFVNEGRYVKIESEPKEPIKAEVTPKKSEEPKEVEDPLVGFYKDLENNTLDVVATGDKEKSYRYTYTKDEEGATPTVREVTEKQLKNALGGNFKKVEAVKKPAEESSEEPSTTEIEKLRKAKAEARLQAIKEATEEAKAAKSKAWEVLSKNAKTRKVFISQFSDKLGTDKSIDGMIDLMSNDIKEFAKHVDTAVGPKIEVGGFTMKRDRARIVSTNVLAKLEKMNKRIEEGCK